MISENAVASEEVLINAPVELVWQILVDFENYGQWNEFCPQITAELKLGSPVDMMTDLGNGLQQQVEYITQIEPNHIIAWSMKNEPGDPVHACRTQQLTKVTDSSCIYYTVDEFSGEFMPAMLENFGVHIEAGFNRCAQGLKRHAEQRFAASA